MSKNSGSQADLRSYLSYARKRGTSAYLEIQKPISPKWETALLVSELARKMRNPVLYFQSVKDCKMSMASNVCCSVDRVARSAGISVDELNERLCNAVASPIEPMQIEAGAAPVREVILSENEFSLRSFPQLFYTDTQSDPYITSAIVVARDPDTGAHNLSFHRLMISDAREAAIYMTPGSHLDQIWQKNTAVGKPTPLAAVIGTHPLWCYASLVSGRLDQDDYNVVGAVLNEPLQLVQGEVDRLLLIPARAEIVLEGCIDPARTQDEGPFGEFLGYVAARAPRPVVTFTHLSSRHEPIFQDIVAGQSEHITMSSVALRARLDREYFRDNNAIVDVWLPAAMTLFFTVDTERADNFNAGSFMKEILMAERYLKQVVCFDAGVDLRKQASVQSSLACFVQANRDVQIYDGCDGNGVDPSEVDGKTAKIAIDARSKGNPATNRLPSALVDSFDLSTWVDW